MRKTSELVPYERNPRKNEKAVDAVTESIRQFGFKVPIVLDKDNVIIAGHTRLKAAEKLGLEEVPTITADDLTPEQVKAFRLADNKTAELAGWDFDLLDEELDDITGLDMTAFGFDDGAVEEEKYSLEEQTAEVVELPPSRIIVAGVSAFGENSEAFVVKEIPTELSEQIISAIKDHGGADTIADRIEQAVREAIA
jgi:site-specific DNA-methyltransferase (adenine-specific)